MNIVIAPDPVEKIIQMGDVAGFEPAGDAPHEEPDKPGCFTPATRRAERNVDALRGSISLVSSPYGSKKVLNSMF